MFTVQVLPATNIDRTFDYAWDFDVAPQLGHIIMIPFGRQKIWGAVISQNKSTLPKDKLKSVISIADVEPLPQNLLTFIHRFADYTLTPKGAVLKLSLSSLTALTADKPTFVFVKNENAPTHQLTKKQLDALSIIEKNPCQTKSNLQKQFHIGPTIINKLLTLNQIIPVAEKIKPTKPHAPKKFPLSPDQETAVEKLTALMDQKTFMPILLDGVTGSGKTETYLMAAAHTVLTGKQVLIILPEIALTPQLVKRFEDRLGIVPALWHSDVTLSRKKNIWRDVLSGDMQIVIGARSSLFLPFSNLGLIVVDEEHDTSFKQEEGVIYHGRDMAVLRAQCENAAIILSSATPSLETTHNVSTHKFQHVHLPSRHGMATPPQVSLIDLRAHKLKAADWIAPPLKEEIEKSLTRNEQVLLFLNRRGYAPLTLCRTCGFRFQCPNCSTWLVSHSHTDKSWLNCHHCGYKTIQPDTCPKCKSEKSFAACGPGVERLAEEVKKLFPNARTHILASDTLETTHDLTKVIDDIRTHKIDIIIGTQLVAKGHDFPNLTLVGVVDADMGLMGGDLRAAEKTFQLLHQVSGRAGRAEKPGRVFIQTYNPDTPIMQALKHNDRDGFMAEELQSRQLRHLPPFGRLALITLLSPKLDVVDQISRDLARHMPHHPTITVLGPATPPLAKLRGKFRKRFLLIAKDKKTSLQHFITGWLTQDRVPKSTKIQIDIDPVSFV